MQLPKKEKTFKSLHIILRKPGRKLQTSTLGDIAHDYVLQIYDLEAPFEPPRTGFTLHDRDQPKTELEWLLNQMCCLPDCTSVTISSAGGSAKQLGIVLAIIIPLVPEGCDLSLIGFSVTKKHFDAITSTFEHVYLTLCKIGRGWWKPATREGVCTWLTMECCTGVIPARLKPGQAWWPALKTLQLCARERPMSLRKGGEYPTSGLPALDYDTFAKVWIWVLWGGVEMLLVNDYESLELLTELPPRSTLKTLDLYSVVTPTVFDWALTHKNVQSLSLAWAKGTALPWAKLRRLKRLRSMGLDDTFLTDSELATIAANTKLRSVVAYYTDITPESWQLILSWPGLVQFWGSQELGGLPEGGLPEETTLVEFVALNTRFSWFVDFLSRYPNVKVVEM